MLSPQAVMTALWQFPILCLGARPEGAALVCFHKHVHCYVQVIIWCQYLVCTLSGFMYIYTLSDIISSVSLHIPVLTLFLNHRLELKSWVYAVSAGTAAAANMGHCSSMQPHSFPWLLAFLTPAWCMMPASNHQTLLIQLLQVGLVGFGLSF